MSVQYEYQHLPISPDQLLGLYKLLMQPHLEFQSQISFSTAAVTYINGVDHIQKMAI